MTLVAVVGAGQLGQMLGEAGAALDVECRFLDPAPSPPAATAGRVIARGYDDPDGLAELCSGADVLTYEFENVPVAGLKHVPRTVPIYPRPVALEKAQDRWHEKTLFDTLDIPTSPFLNVESHEDALAAGNELGLPLVFKTRRFGYDGKGQAVVRDRAALAGVWQSLGEVPLIAEQLIDFEREVSIIGARRVNGDVAHWPLSENRHAEGILRVSLAPYRDDALHALAVDYHRRLLEALDYVGVLTLELFVCRGQLMANEFAPRVHNSGHWTIEGARTSQFENHLRAILDLPLGDTGVPGSAAMVNLIGDIPAKVSHLGENGLYVHDYGKSPRAGRKLGHIALVAADDDERDKRLNSLSETLSTP